MIRDSYIMNTVSQYPEEALDRLWFASMHLIASRRVAFIDAASLEERHAAEALFRGEAGGFVLYMSDGDGWLDGEERIICLNARDALIWINETADNQGSFWA